MNARDLSEPPKYGTTSGCPPPSQHHNYRRSLHTQQRNRFERRKSERFWKGVAQITRNRDRPFITSLCSITLFSIGSIWRTDRCTGRRDRRFSRPRPPIRAESKAEVRPIRHKTIREMVRSREAAASTATPLTARRFAIIRAEPEQNTRYVAESQSRPPDLRTRMRESQKALCFGLKMLFRSSQEHRNSGALRAGSSGSRRGALKKKIAPRRHRRVRQKQSASACRRFASASIGSAMPCLFEFDSPNLPLAARARVGHIGLDGAVAEWLKAAVC